ncbi:hypothetical protein POPTR_001G119000v4 [Populus trichocarpa]|uniref:Bifunctional inhibitor/plant lipid transfer protein/seed storage helical domain-containing protein n=1 Tax=Populus trichocarpa TaxID=3694 RepID=A0A2K2BW90_POPTR|nr:non-specific lipid transfer protein GPI-anchored 7 isoform X1 [Populus trichocarpa]PNT54051.1 hypothetical protein POPTR_001G119000v4 [Populus trichocarpa]|eukprot:XP_006368690.2 lipid transfer-like protein VAS isoform X1 [Populus trichocarpa]
MASSLKISILAMMVVVFFSSATTLTRAQDQSTSCASKLVPCQAYLSTTTQPPDSCCNSIKEAVANELPCLCKLYNDPNLFQSLGINVTQAVMLSQRCGVTTNLTSCSASAPTPAGSAVPGNDGDNGGSRMSLSTGLSGLLVLLVASLLH